MVVKRICTQKTWHAPSSLLHLGELFWLEHVLGPHLSFSFWGTPRKPGAMLSNSARQVIAMLDAMLHNFGHYLIFRGSARQFWAMPDNFDNA